VGETENYTKKYVDSNHDYSYDESPIMAQETYEDNDFYDDNGELTVTTRNNYKSKISYHEEVNKPIMAIFFNFFNYLSHKRTNENINNYRGVEFKGILDNGNGYIDYLPDFPPTVFEYTV